MTRRAFTAGSIHIAPPRETSCAPSQRGISWPRIASPASSRRKERRHEERTSHGPCSAASRHLLPASGEKDLEGGRRLGEGRMSVDRTIAPPPGPPRPYHFPHVARRTLATGLRVLAA